MIVPRPRFLGRLAERHHVQTSVSAAGRLPGVVGEERYLSAGKRLDADRSINNLIVSDRQPHMPRRVKQDLHGDCAPRDPYLAEPREVLWTKLRLRRCSLELTIQHSQAV